MLNNNNPAFKSSKWSKVVGCEKSAYNLRLFVRLLVFLQHETPKTMKINVNGNEVEAYALIMKKENALEILRGEKTIEIRVDSPKYVKMFTDQEQVERNRKAEAEGRDEWESPLRKDIGFVHFYNYAGTWSLDCEIDEIGTASLIKDDIDFLNEEYGFHDFDDQWQEFEGKPEEEIPFFFYLHIAAIVGHRGLE